MRLLLGNTGDGAIWAKMDRFSHEGLVRIRKISGGKWVEQAKHWRFGYSKELVEEIYSLFAEQEVVPSKELLRDAVFQRGRRDGIEKKAGEAAVNEGMKEMTGQIGTRRMERLIGLIGSIGPVRIERLIRVNPVISTLSILPIRSVVLKRRENLMSLKRLLWDVQVNSGGAWRKY